MRMNIVFHHVEKFRKGKAKLQLAIGRKRCQSLYIATKDIGEILSGEEKTVKFHCRRILIFYLRKQYSLFTQSIRI